VGELEAALALGEGAGERAFLVSEELALDEVFRDGGAVDADERGGGAGALAVEGAGDEFLAGAAFALDKDGGLGAGDLADQLAQILHDRAATQQFVTAFLVLLIAQVLVDLEELGEVLGLLERHLELVRGEGLDEVVERPVAHAIDGGFDGAEAGDDDHERLLGPALEFAQEIGAVAVREPDIDEDEVEVVLGQEFLGGGDRAGGRHVVTALAELLLEILADDQIVLEHHDFLDRHWR